MVRVVLIIPKQNVSQQNVSQQNVSQQNVSQQNSTGKLKGAINYNNTTYVGYTLAQIQQIEIEKLNKKINKLN